jgi:DNA excision repair protein ERCC-2
LLVIRNGVTLRFDDELKTLSLSVRDVIHEGMPRGHLSIEVVQSRQARMAAGRAVHTAYQGARAAEDADFRAEVRLENQILVAGWSVRIHGRVDGLTEENGQAVVEEVKSTALPSDRLHHTTLQDWGIYVEQLELYLWMLASARYHLPVGRLVFVSLVDGSHHVLQMDCDEPAIRKMVVERVTELVLARERRKEWLAARRNLQMVVPFDGWRDGQAEISDSVLAALKEDRPALVQAPTGLGKTAAVFHGVLRYALANDKQVFWATSRTTQQSVALATLARFGDAGLSMRVTQISAKDKVCLNDVVSCRADACRYAENYYDKLRDTGVVKSMLDRGRMGRQDLEWAGRMSAVCPYQLALDVSEQVDVVVGDYNYAFDPSVMLRRHFGDTTAGDWIVVADEVHQLVERARGYLSPKVKMAWVDAAVMQLVAGGTAYEQFVTLAREIRQLLEEVGFTIVGPSRGGEAVAEPSMPLWRDLSERIDEVGLDYAMLKAEQPLVQPGEPDAWVDLARAVLRFAQLLGEAEEDTVCLVRPGVQLGLCNLDPSRFMAPTLERLGGFVGASATVSPTRFYRDLLGLPPTTSWIDVASPFPPSNQCVLVAPRVSTTFRDRVQHAQPTAELIQRCIEATPGNVALYAPSFAMLDDLTRRLRLEDRDLLVQERSMDDARREQWLERLRAGGRPVVLAAALGGIFAEGIDLPPGALSTVVVVGPALPPVGLERDLLRSYFEERYDNGFLYASLIPGMTRVVQAAGRLIRRAEDRGVVVLVGRRFRFREYAGLLPDRWNAQLSDEPAADVAKFWEAGCV